MPKTTQVSLGYEARPQFVPFHQRARRWACIVAHRRAGKTLACVADLVDAALRTKKEAARFAYVAPTFGQAKDIAWGYLKRLTAPIPGVETREVDLATVLPNGARIRLYGADAYDRLRGVYLDGVVLDEVADFDPRAWPEVIRPALADRQGWGVFIGTPKGRNAFWDVWNAAQTDADWFTMMLRASESGLLPEDELNGMRKLLSHEAYAQEMECSFDAAVVGSYYGRLLDEAQSEGRIGVVPVERGAAVHTAWDLGIGDSTAIWFFQTIGREVRVIDYHEASGEALDHYAKVLQSRGYVYGEHYLPHDAEARELGTGTTRLETLGKLGVRGRVVPAQAKDDSINAVRMLLPRCWFDAERCKVGLEMLRMYRRDFDERLKTFRDRPRHDFTSHAADAFAQFAIGHREHAAPDMAAVRARLRQGRASGWMAA